MPHIELFVNMKYDKSAVNEHFFEGQRLSDKTCKKIERTLQQLREELGNVEWTDVHDHGSSVFTVTFTDNAGTRHTLGFTKIGDSLPVDGGFYPIEEVVEASVRFPDNLEEGIKIIHKTHQEEKEGV